MIKNNHNLLTTACGDYDALHYIERMTYLTVPQAVSLLATRDWQRTAQIGAQPVDMQGRIAESLVTHLPGSSADTYSFFAKMLMGLVCSGEVGWQARYAPDGRLVPGNPAELVARRFGKH